MASSDKIARAVLELATDNTKFDKGLDAAVSKSKQSGDAILKQFASVGKQMSDMGKLLLPLSASLTALGAGILAVGVAFDSAFDTIRIGTGATGAALDGLKDSFRKVLAGVPDDADKVAKDLADINTRLGLTGKPLEDLTTQLLTLARVTKTDINELIPAATRVFGDWQVATDKQGQTLDYLFKVSQSTGVGLTTLMQKVTDSGAAFKALGFNLEQSAALLGSWEKNGVNADTMLAGLQKAATTFAKANIPVAQGLQTVVDKMLALGPGTESAKLATQVFGKAAISMGDAVFKGQLNVDALVKSLNASKETIQGAAADTDDFAEQWGKFKNQLLLALEPLGGRLFSIINGLMPLLEGLIGAVSNAAKWFGELPESVQATGLALAGLGAVSGPALLAIGSLVTQLPKVVTGIRAMQTALTALAANPYVLALTGLAAAFVILKGEIDKAKQNVADLEARQRSATDATAKYIEKTDGLGNALIDLNHLTDQQKATIAGAAGSVTGLGIAIDLAAGKTRGATVDLGALTGAQEEAKKKAEEQAKALKALEDQLQHTRDVLKSFGLVTGETVSEEMGKFQEAISAALVAGRTLPSVLSTILPKLIAFADDAEKGGADVTLLRNAIKQFQAVLAPGLPTLNHLVSDFDPTKPISGLKAMTGETFALMQQAQRTTEAFHYFGLTMPSELKRAANDAMTAFIALGQSGQATPKQMAEAWKKVQDQIRLAGGEAPKVKITWQEALQGLGASFQQLAQIAGDAMNAISRGVGTAISTVSQLGDALKTAKTASAAGGAAGLIGVAGAAGAIFSAEVMVTNAIVGAMESARLKQTMQQVAKDFGVAISEETAHGVQVAAYNATRPATQQKQPGRGDNRTADYLKSLGLTSTAFGELLNIDKIIADGGGLTKANFDIWVNRSTKLFDVIAAGGDGATQATETLGRALHLFATQATETGGLWSASFQSMIAQAKALGVGLEDITKLIDDQLSAVASATAKATGGLTVVLDKASKKIDDLTAKQNDQADRGDTAGAADTALQLKALTTQTITELQPEFDRLNRITLASFNAYIAQGHSAVEAIAAVGPAFDSLKAAADKFGFAGNDAFNQLSRWRDLTTQNQPLLDQVSGLNELMVALANVGSLDASTFADLQAQGVQTFGQLTAAGFTQQEALAQMAPMLQTIKDLHEQNGLAIDDTTQALITQAEQQGVVKDKEETTQDVLKDGFSALLKALGVDLPAAWKTFSKAGKDAASDVGKALADIPDKTVRVNVETSGWPSDWPPTDGSGTGAGTPTGYPGTESQQGFAWGTPNLDFAAFNKAGQSILAHGNEAIIPKGSGHQLAGEIAAAMGGMSPASGPINVTIQAWDGADVQRVVTSRDFAEAFSRAAQFNTHGIGTAVRQAGA